MKVYTAIKEFIIKPQNVTIHVGDTLTKYDNTVVVSFDSSYSTATSFWTWVGSVNSEEFLSLTSSSSDPATPPGTLTPIDPLSNYSTTDIVNTINGVITYLNMGA